MQVDKKDNFKHYEPPYKVGDVLEFRGSHPRFLEIVFDGFGPEAIPVKLQGFAGDSVRIFPQAILKVADNAENRQSQKDGYLYPHHFKYLYRVQCRRLRRTFYRDRVREISPFHLFEV